MSQTRVSVVTPAPSAPQLSSLDEVADGLLQLRAAAGSPSFTTIARRVGQYRAARGLPASECEPGRVTVYDCFRTGRRRMQPELVSDIAAVLGAPTSLARSWAQACIAVQARSDAAGIVTVRTELPTSPGPFVGREATIRSLVRRAQQEPGSVFVLHGMAGSGKTRLAVRVADALIRAGTTARPVFAELRGHHADKPPADPRAVIDAILRSLGVPSRDVPRTLRDKRRMLAMLTQKQQCVLILDDAHDSAQVAALVPRGTAPVLITSRHRLSDLVHVTSRAVGPLSEREGLQLLGTIAGQGTVGDAAVARDLVQATGLLPLSVGLAATRVAARPEWSLQDHLATLLSRREALQLDDAVQAGLALSYRPLTPAASRLLRLLAVQPCEELDAVACTALAGDDAGPFLRELTDRHLVTERSPGRYSHHDLTRAFAVARSLDEDRPSDREQALDRLHQHLTASVQSAAQQLGPGAQARLETGPSTRTFESDEAAAAWVTAEFDTLLALTAHAASTGRAATAVSISELLSFWLIRSCDRSDVGDLHRNALRAAEQSDDATGVARASLAIGQVLVRSTSFTAALPPLRRALAIFDATHQPLEASRALTALAMIDVHQGRLESAIERFSRVAAVACECGDTLREAIAQDNLAVAYIRAGRYQEALGCHQRSLALAADSGDDYTRANVLLNMAGMHQLLNQPELALPLAEETLQLSLTLGLRPTEAYALSTIGSALIDLSRHDEASDALGRSLTIATEVGDRVLQSAVTGHLGRLQLTLGHIEPARTLLTQAADIAADVGATYEEACAWDTLAGLELAAQQPDTARQWWTRALTGFEAMGAPEADRVRTHLADLN